jgi:hypothetical protein
MDPYNEAHLFIAAIRIVLYQKQSPPTIDEVCSTLNISVEAGLATCRSLEKLGIIDISEDPFSIKLAIANHLEIEKLAPRSRPVFKCPCCKAAMLIVKFRRNNRRPG